MFHIIKWWIPPSLHSFRDVSRVSWPHLGAELRQSHPSLLAEHRWLAYSFPSAPCRVRPPITLVFESLLTLATKPRHGTLSWERLFLSPVAFETRLENGVREEEMTWRRQHPWRSQQNFLTLQGEPVLDYLLTSKLRLVGNSERVWLGFVRTFDSLRWWEISSPISEVIAL